MVSVAITEIPDGDEDTGYRSEKRGYRTDYADDFCGIHWSNPRVYS